MSDELPAPAAESLPINETLVSTSNGVVASFVNANGITETTVIEDRTDGGVDMRVSYSYDAEPTLKAVHNSHMETGGKSKTNELWHIGEIPVVLLMDMARRFGLDNYLELTKPEFMPYVVALCRDGDFRRLSPTGGKA